MTRPDQTTDAPRDLRLPGGCLLCGGDLELRIGAGTARSWCGRCRWMSRPHLSRDDEGIHLVHPGLVA
jgi:hypothetical protein